MWIELLHALAAALVALWLATVGMMLAAGARHVWRALRWRRRLRELLRGQPTQLDHDEHMRRMRGR